MKTAKIFHAMMVLTALVFMGTSTGYALGINPAYTTIPLVGLGLIVQNNPVGVLCTYVALSVFKPGENAGLGQDHKDEIIIFDWADVVSGYTRTADGITITGPLVFKAGAYMIKVYGTLHTIGTSADTEGDPDNKGIKQGVKFSHPGNKAEIRAFRWNWLNKNIGIIDRKCSSDGKDLYGSPCNPLQLNFKSKNDKDGNNAEMEFMSVGRGPDVAIYEGTLTLETVAGTVAADATTVNLASGEGQYQLTDGSASAATLTTGSNAVDGMVFTLLGSGGSFPSEISGTDFLLRNGTAWTALAGSQITFKAFKSGSSSWKFIEQSRS
jgi:hypothetical protein